MQAKDLRKGDTFKLVHPSPNMDDCIFRVSTQPYVNIPGFIYADCILGSEKGHAMSILETAEVEEGSSLAFYIGKTETLDEIERLINLTRDNLLDIANQLLANVKETTMLESNCLALVTIALTRLGKLAIVTENGCKFIPLGTFGCFEKDSELRLRYNTKYSSDETMHVISVSAITAFSVMPQYAFKA